MFKLKESARIFVYFEPIDLRKAIDGLSYLVLSCLNQRPESGDLFIFRNRIGDKIKAIYWDRNGFVLFYKRLDKGKFCFSKSMNSSSLTITAEQLDWLLMGFDFMVTKKGQSETNAVLHYY